MGKFVILTMTMILLLGMSSGVMALDNPWKDDGAEVNVTLSISQMGEVWSAIGTGQARDGDSALKLEIDNAAGILPSDGSGVAEDTLSHFANVDYNVLVDIAGEIPENARFHVLLNPTNRGLYDEINSGGGTTVPIADGIFTFTGTQTEGTDIKTLITNNASLTSNSTPVDYAMDAISGLPPVGDEDIEGIYTITAQ